MSPGLILYCNNDLTPGVQNPLVNQLRIDEVIMGEEFDLRVANDPNYTNIIYDNNLRVLVLRDYFVDGYNRDLADVVVFIKAGLLTIQANKFGPPGQTFQVDKITIYDLLRNYPTSTSFRRSAGVQDNILSPINPYRYDSKKYPFGTDKSIVPGGKGALIPEEDE